VNVKSGVRDQELDDQPPTQSAESLGYLRSISM
jgi:hypothetical protein